jgi:hypothetical protein
MGMSPDRKRARAATKEALEAVRELIAAGVVPRRVTVGEVTIEVASYAAPRPEATADGEPVRFRGIDDRIADRMRRLRGPVGSPGPGSRKGGGN